MDKILLIGAGGHSRSCIDVVEAENKFTLLFEACNDIPSNTMSQRCKQFIDSPPSNWLGIAVMTEK